MTDQKSLEKEIKNLYYVQKMPIRRVVETLTARGHKVNYSMVQRFLKEEQLKNYDDTELERLVRIDNYNALSLVDNLFQAAAQSARELAQVNLVAMELRSQVAEILREKGVMGLAAEKELLELWNKNTEKMTKLAGNVPKYIESYNNLLTNTLNVQKQFSFVRLATEELKNLSPEMHRKIMDGLNRDENARALMTNISAQDVRDYWDEKDAIAQRRVLSNGSEEE